MPLGNRPTSSLRPSSEHVTSTLHLSMMITLDVSLLISGTALDERGVVATLGLQPEELWLAQPGIVDLDGTWLHDDARRRWRLSTAGRMQGAALDVHLEVLLAAIYPRRELLRDLAPATLQLQGHFGFDRSSRPRRDDVIEMLIAPRRLPPIISPRIVEMLSELELSTMEWHEDPLPTPC
jgi:hypothetical protein